MFLGILKVTITLVRQEIYYCQSMAIFTRSHPKISSRVSKVRNALEVIIITTINDNNNNNKISIIIIVIISGQIFCGKWVRQSNRMVNGSWSSSSIRDLTEKVHYHTTVILLKQMHPNSLFQTKKSKTNGCYLWHLGFNAWACFWVNWCQTVLHVR